MNPLQAGDPHEVGTYRLLRRLGAGGMGQVFLGRSRTGRLVALKLLRSELAGDPKFRRRFAHEVELASSVGGFYTAQVVDADPDANPPYLVTAYVPGPSLFEAIELHGGLPERTLSVLGAGLAEGLIAIHQRGIIHRDFKPSNVILAPDGPRVIDFGIARALDTTQTTTVMGTPAFMSPEQVEGRTLGSPSDVFSFGVVLAYAATGVNPFGTGPGDAVTYRIVHHTPDLAGIPSALAPLAAACMAKDPTQRPSLTAVVNDLAGSTDDVGEWLPPDITKMIDARYLPSAGLPKDHSHSAHTASGHPGDDRIVVRRPAGGTAPDDPADSSPDPAPARRWSPRRSVIFGTVAAAITVASLSVTAVMLVSGSSASSTASPPSGQTVIGGRVYCTSGKPLSGVWVETKEGKDYAYVRKDQDATYSYHLHLPTRETYKVHVGCGGTLETWKFAIKQSPRVSGTRNSFICHDVAEELDFGTCTKG